MKLVATVSSLKEVKLAEKADLIEIRLDLFNRVWEAIDEIRGIEKEIIATCRRERDGGKFTGREEERIEALRKFAEETNVAYVDVECDMPDSAFNFDCEIIESYHNFKETPDYSELRSIVEGKRGDLVKVVTMGRSKKDVGKIVKLLLEFEGVIAFLMGKEFSFTRIMAAYLGSPFIYCHVGESKAPGQIHLNDAYKILKTLG
ncbi:MULTISPECIES: type I 3-dehydroquinate dehydratase [unclassified Archaeoglobus]|jgi:3-dehydroquinate dehydratase type I|uniref:type I 3-dehydroquinate dehydratase n=1 Tax=unclassified Archaeoglobus TaxID=2643606 RepID=UPI0025C154DC|nr:MULTISPECIES: type I 3-dehydroquinate dehydratase [unclassified Archaeoglobus]